MLVRLTELSETLDQIRVHGDLCRADDGRFRSCGDDLPPDLLARAEKMKSPLDTRTKARLLKLGCSTFPPVGTDPGTIKVRLDVDPLKHALVKWVSPKDGLPKRGYAQAFHDQNAGKKWDRVMAYRPRLAALRENLRKRLRSKKFGTPDHQAATVAAVIAYTALRPGGPRDKEGHVGVSTMLAEHVQIKDGVASIYYVGKAGKVNKAEMRDPDVVAALSRYKKKADGGRLFGIGPEKARQMVPPGMKLKDLRTILGTEFAEKRLREIKPPPPLPKDPKAAKALIAKVYMQASKDVAKFLNNTPAIARASYIHPNVLMEWVREIGGGELATA